MSPIKSSGSRRPIYSPVSNHFRFLPLIAAFLIVAGLHGQETCSEEVKVLLSPMQLQTAIPALRARGQTHERIYFYDTAALDLLSKGVILRFREGAEIDLTAKLRPLPGAKSAYAHDKRYECEVDLNDGVENPSFSLQNRDLAAKAPQTGEELFQLLSEGQKVLVADSKVPIDWQRVKRIAEIQSTIWKSGKKAPLGKLSLELWEWPGGSILEVSKKVETDAGQATYAELKDLAGKNGLGLNTDQRSKTAIALEAITTAHQR